MLYSFSIYCSLSGSLTTDDQKRLQDSLKNITYRWMKTCVHSIYVSGCFWFKMIETRKAFQKNIIFWSNTFVLCDWSRWFSLFLGFNSFSIKKSPQLIPRYNVFVRTCTTTQIMSSKKLLIQIYQSREQTSLSRFLCISYVRSISEWK